MKEDKKIKKEQFIIESAERVFEKVGFKNAKMDDIAAAAGITKVTLYSYFQSKENLYLAITYNALSALNEVYLQTIKKNERFFIVFFLFVNQPNVIISGSQ